MRGVCLSLFCTFFFSSPLLAAKLIGPRTGCQFFKKMSIFPTPTPLKNSLLPRLCILPPPQGQGKLHFHTVYLVLCVFFYCSCYKHTFVLHTFFVLQTHFFVTNKLFCYKHTFLCCTLFFVLQTLFFVLQTLLCYK